jgi:hypothetical protein
MVSRSRYRRVTVLSVFLILFLGFLAFPSRHRDASAVTSLQDRYPLLWKIVHTFEGHGGGKENFITIPARWSPLSE